MEIRNILKKYMIDFLMIQAGITLAIGIISCINPPPAGINRYMFFMPFVYAFLCLLPSFVTYSREELSIKQMTVRKVIQFVLIELLVVLVSCIMGPLHDIFMGIAIIMVVAVIYAVVNCLDYLIFKADAEAMTKKLQRIKEQQGSKQHE